MALFDLSPTVAIKLMGEESEVKRELPTCKPRAKTWPSRHDVYASIRADWTTRPMTQDNLPARTLAMAAIRAAEAQGGGGMVLKRGDPGSGVIMIKVMDRAGQSVVYSQTRDPNGQPVWFRPTGPDPVPETEADERLARERKFDPDIWIIEIQNDALSHPLDPEML